MKVRLGFVSNSSSSSFTCDVCKHTDSGWECVNGHIFCEDHVVEPSTVELRELLEEIQEDIGDPDLEDEMNTTADDDLLDLYNRWKNDEERYECSAKLCPICNMDVLTDNDLIKLLLKRMSTTRDEITKATKKEFENAEAFWSYLEG